MFSMCLCVKKNKNSTFVKFFKCTYFCLHIHKSRSIYNKIIVNLWKN